MHSTCEDLHVIAAHVLGRRRFAVSGHFGLRASPRGVATPAFGPEPEVLRLAGAHLVREVGNETRTMPIDGASAGGTGGVRRGRPGVGLLGGCGHAGARCA